MDRNNLKIIESTWNSIAESFDKTRKKPWEICQKFISTLSPSSTVGDFGCGNGRHTKICSAYCSRVIALDLSNLLLNIAKNSMLYNNCQNVDYIHGSLTNIPLKNEVLDAVISIATIHNIPRKENRIQSLHEIYRILKKDGITLISVWSKHQKKYQITKNNVINEFNLEEGDRIVYWDQNHKHVPRFYHFYGEEEFEDDLKKAGFTSFTIRNVSLASKDKDNYFAFLNK